MAGEEVVGSILGYLRLDADQFHREITQAIAEVKALKGQSVKVKVKTDVKDAERELRRVSKAAQGVTRDVGGMGRSFKGLHDPRVIVGGVATGMALLGPVTGAAAGALGGFVGVLGTGILAFQGFQAEVENATALGVVLQGQLEGVKGEFQSLSATAARAMQGDVLSAFGEVRRFLPTINGDVEALAGHLGLAFNISTKGLISGLQTAMPLLRDGGRYAVVLAEKFADFTASQDFKDFVDYARRELPNVGSAVLDLAGGVKDLAVALAPVGDDLVGIISLFGKLSSAIGPVVGLLAKNPFGALSALDQVNGIVERFTGNNEKAASAVGEHTSYLLTLRGALSPTAAALGITNAELKTATDVQRKTAEAASAATLQMQLEGNAAGLLKQALDGLNGKTLNLSSAQTSSASATLGVTRALKDNGTTLKLNTEAGVSNRQAIEAKARADQALAEATATATGSTKAGTKSLADSKVALENALRAQGRLTPAVQAYIDKVYQVPKVAPTKAEFNATQALTGIAAFQKAIDSLRGKTVTAGVRYAYTGRLPNGGRSTAGGSTFNEADGGVVKYYASGGFESHVAQIAKGGSTRVWNEPETGGEAYIPLAQSKRPRSERILAETNRMMGSPLDGGGIDYQQLAAALTSAMSRVVLQPVVSVGSVDRALGAGMRV